MENNLPSERHKVFVDNLLDGKSVAESGKIAGFSTPSRDATPVIASAVVKAYARKHLRGRLELEAAPAAYKLLYDTMQDATADKRLRIDIAKFLYASAGYTPPKAQEASPDGEKAPSEMSSDELRRFIEEGEAELAGRARLLNPPQALDSLM